MFYLEGGHEEAVARVKWKKMCQIYFNQKEVYIDNFDYINWKANGINHPFVKQVETKIEEKMKEFSNFWIYPISKGFTVDDLYSALLEFHELVPSPSDISPFGATGKFNLDLIIVDHLQYFELNGTEHEIVQTTKILRCLKDISDVYKIPVVLISHLRKKSRDRGLPDQEDFYGSSNVVKIATNAILLSSDTSKEDFSDNIYPTFIRIAKSRVGVRPNHVIRINFDLTKREYEKDYEVFYVREGKISSSAIEYSKWPKWGIKTHIIKYKENWHEEKAWDDDL